MKQEAVITMVTGAQEVTVEVGLEVSVAQATHSTSCVQVVDNSI
jgi:hypothetical protein